ncbi:HBL/NHE enterotoxin family protein [Inquilinus sp.]|jgi:chromosome segregation ATPase|uniref:HBL/NHE enterotoxin family protein n=1 Tax=Inquilinus sp. TaxID=1932117 RepID=UPI003784EC88
MTVRKWHRFDQSNDPNGPVTQSMSQALTVQTYCISVAQQPTYDFSEDEHLKQYQDPLNEMVKNAQDAANGYLNNTQQDCLTTLDNLVHFIDLQNTRIDEYTSGQMTAKDLAAALQKVQTVMAPKYQGQCNDLVKELDDFRSSVSSIESKFSNIVNDLNNAVSGDGGELTKLQDQVSGLDKEIALMSAGSILSMLGMLGGALMIAIGAAGEVVSGGASTALVAGGVALAGASTAGEVEAGKSLISLLNQKAELLKDIADIKYEVTQAHSSAGGMKALSDQAGQTVTALQQMANAWTTLSKKLQDIIDDLDMDSGDIKSEVADYKTDIGKLQQACQTIQNQFAGVNKTNDNSKTVADILNGQINQAA